MSILSQADLEVAVGGAAVLRDLLDKNNDGSADADQVNAVLLAVDVEILTAAGVAFETATLVPPYPPAFIIHGRFIGAYYAYLQSTSGMAMPEATRLAYENSTKWLDKLAHGDRGAGVATPPAAAHAIKQVDVNPTASTSNNTAQPADGTRITRATMRGFY